jgi:hypothetical protein
MKTEVKTELYYNQDGITVQRATRADAEYVAYNMRRQDVQEIWDAAHLTPASAMKYSVEKTVFCLSIRVNGVPVGLFGVNGVTMLGNNGIVWLLGTDDIKKIGYRFVKHSRKFVKMMNEFYPVIFNYVSIENTVSIAWLKGLGAKFDLARPFGLEGKLFRYFWFEREANNV